MNRKSIIILLAGSMLLLMSDISSEACNCQGSPPGPCYKCQYGQWVPCGLSCPACRTCVSQGTYCECVWACGQGNCCNGSCCSGTCCNGTCCPTGQACCNEICCAAGQNCCNDLTCYDPSTQQCCGDGVGTICGINQICCDGDCCEDWQCCIDGECVDPICGNCHYINENVWECFHWESAPNGTPCLIYQCIENIFNTATCDYIGTDPRCAPHCDTTYLFPWAPEWVQIVHNSPCSGGIVYFLPWFQFWFGCDECITPGPINLACVEAYPCFYNPIPGSYLPRPEGSKQCGGCAY